MFITDYWLTGNRGVYKNKSVEYYIDDIIASRGNIIHKAQSDNRIDFRSKFKKGFNFFENAI